MFLIYSNKVTSANVDFKRNIIGSHSSHPRKERFLLKHSLSFGPGEHKHLFELSPYMLSETDPVHAIHECLAGTGLG